MRNPLREICTAGSVRGEARCRHGEAYVGTKLETAETDKAILTGDIGLSSTRSRFMTTS